MRKFVHVLMIVAMFSFMFVSGAPMVSKAETTGNTVNLPAKTWGGEVYIKADAFLKAFGGSGKYDPYTETFQYTMSNKVTDVVEQVSPAVVAIIGKPDELVGTRYDSRFRLAHGTGVIIESNGVIVTNAHVVKGMNKIVVVTASGDQYNGTVTHMDEESDLALVKINATELPFVPFAPDGVKVGETVVAIGTPISFSLRNSATVGVVSGVNRSMHSTYRLIQTDAAINPGNSGGPLVNLNGEIVGINSLKFAAVGIDNLGFAIPTETVQYVLEHFDKYGEVKRPYFGAELDESWAAVIGLPTTEPLTVAQVEEGSPADRSGIESGDKIYSIDGHSISTIVEFNELLKDYLPGQEVEVVLQSHGNIIYQKVILSEENN